MVTTSVSKTRNNSRQYRVVVVLNCSLRLFEGSFILERGLTLSSAWLRRFAGYFSAFDFISSIFLAIPASCFSYSRLEVRNLFLM